MSPDQLLGLMIVVVVPTLLLAYLAKRFFALKERQVEANSHLAAEKAAQYANDKATLAARVAVLEQIVTDGGYDTAAKIDALRPQRLSAQGEVR